ncbi:MAG: hypothetical protein K1Y36_28200 [Blastocatellia bacterium]|nr:hypothetical protein [Blastocatellia bacterium]
MRDRNKYKEAGRHDPHSPEQMVEHPYDFVEFPQRVETVGTKGVERLYHDRSIPNTLTGKLKLEFTALSSITVGSGLLELAGDVGLKGDEVVRGIVMRDGKPIIPGASIKGAVRSNYELITLSTMASFGIRVTEPYDAQDRERSKIPRPVLEEAGVNNSGKVEVILDGTMDHLRASTVKNPNDLARLCPASALFGAMGYRGRLHFNDATVREMPPKTEPIKTPGLNQPHLHRVGFTLTRRPGANRLTVTDLFGRKVYYNTEGEDTGNEPSNYLPKGTILETEITFLSLLPEELGGLLAALATDNEFLFRLGGGKPAGRGKVQVSLKHMELSEKPRQRYQTYRAKTEVVNVGEKAQTLKNAFRNCRFFSEDGFQQLCSITQLKKPSGGKP